MSYEFVKMRASTQEKLAKVFVGRLDEAVPYNDILLHFGNRVRDVDNALERPGFTKVKYSSDGTPYGYIYSSEYYREALAQGYPFYPDKDPKFPTSEVEFLRETKANLEESVDRIDLVAKQLLAAISELPEVAYTKDGDPNRLWYTFPIMDVASEPRLVEIDEAGQAFAKTIHTLLGNQSGTLQGLLKLQQAFITQVSALRQDTKEYAKLLHQLNYPKGQDPLA